MPKLIPFTQDHDTGGFFAAAREGRLATRVCTACGHGTFPPTKHCPECGSWDTEWKTLDGTGTLYTWTTITHQLHPYYPTPYTVVVVEPDDCPSVHLVGMIEGAPDLRAGMKMQAWFETIAEDVVLPQWRVVENA